MKRLAISWRIKNKNLEYKLEKLTEEIRRQVSAQKMLSEKKINSRKSK